MPSWTHLIRFIAKEDHQIHIGQLVVQQGLGFELSYRPRLGFPERDTGFRKRSV
jgi:hypothetical protein